MFLRAPLLRSLSSLGRGFSISCCRRGSELLRILLRIKTLVAEDPLELYDLKK